MRVRPFSFKLIIGPQVAFAWLLASLTLGSLALAACEYPGIPHPQAAQAKTIGPQASPAGELAPAAKPEPKTGSGLTTAPAATVAEGKVTVRLEDFKLNPDQLAVKAGAITFFLDNAGRYTHDFRIEGQGIDEKAPKIGAGRSGEWGISLKPGEYAISCPISNHAERGMAGKLVVVE